MKHILTTYTTTIKQSGSRYCVGECSCSWKYEGTYKYEVVQAFKRHKDNHCGRNATDKKD